MNQVQQDIEVGWITVSTLEGTMAYLEGSIFNRMQFWMERMADLNMTSLEKIKIICQDYLGKTLTISQCGNVQRIMGLFEVVASNADIGNIREFRKSFALYPEGMVNMIKTFMFNARKRIAIDIVHSYKRIAEKSDNIEDRIDGYMAFGLSEKEAREAIAAGQLTHNFYELAGLTEYPDLAS